MRARSLCCALISLATAPGSAQEAQVEAAVTEHMRARHIPGLSLAVGAGGKVVYARAFGGADLEHRVPTTSATLFGLQSTQKLLTATAMLRLVQTGRVSLADPVQTHCPAFGVHGWPVTLRDLLTHQAGIRPSDLRDLFNRDHYSSTEAAIRRFARDSLYAEPGSRVMYSNAGYTLLACAIEGVTGQAYDSALAELVLRPSRSRSARPDNVFQVVGGRTRYYIVRTADNTAQWRGLWTAAHLEDTPLDQPFNADPVDPSWAIGAGNYLGTPEDMVRFGLALLDGRLLDRGYTDSAFAEVPVRRTGEPSGRTLGGWLEDPSEGGVWRVLGSGWNGSFGLAVSPADSVVVAVASNIQFDQPAELISRILGLWRP